MIRAIILYLIFSWPWPKSTLLPSLIISKYIILYICQVFLERHQYDLLINYSACWTNLDLNLTATQIQLIWKTHIKLTTITMVEFLRLMEWSNLRNYQNEVILILMKIVFHLLTQWKELKLFLKNPVDYFVAPLPKPYVDHNDICRKNSIFNS